MLDLNKEQEIRSRIIENWSSNFLYCTSKCLKWA